MAEPVLAASAIVQCPHSGVVQLTGLVNPRLRIGGVPFVAPGTHPVAGCTFAPEGKFSPCLRVVWDGDSTRIFGSGVPVIIKAESGVCLGAGDIAQGNPVLVAGQTRVFGV